MQSRQNFEAFFNTIDEFLFVLDMKGIILYTNSTVRDRLGYSPKELEGLSVLMVHPEERREEAGKIVLAMLEGKADFCPVPLITKSGVQIPVETRITLGTWDGQPAIFGVTKDISRLQLSEEKFSKLFNLNPSCCGLSDLSTGTYLEVNKAFTRLLGYESEEVIGKTALELGILDDATKRHVLSKADDKGNVYNAEGELTTKRGEKKQVLMSAETIHIQDRLYRMTVIHDISEQKKVERHNLALVEEKNLLLKEVHHRIKNNMGTMMSLLSLQAAKAMNPATVAALTDAQHRLRSMGVLYDKLYRSESMTEMKIDQYLTTLVTEIIATFPNSNKVNVKYAMDSWKMSAKTLSNIGIIVNEILTNSMKYAFSDRSMGSIMVMARMEEGLATIGIADDGAGLPKSMDPDASQGFGMELVRMLAAQMGGSVKFENHHGTRFMLEFKVEAS